MKKEHQSLMRQNYISNYQKPTSSKIFQKPDDDFNTDKYITKIAETLDATRRAEQSVDIDSALKGVKNGLSDLENLQKLNEEQNMDIKKILVNLKGKYKDVNGLVTSTKKQFEELKLKESGLDALEKGKERQDLKGKIEEMKTNLKNTKGGITNILSCLIM